MKQGNKNLLLRLLQQYKELGIAEQIDFTTENIVDHFGFTATIAKRYLRQLTEFGYLEAHGGNKNRTYSKRG